MTTSTLPFYDRVETALHDQTLQTALGRATTRFVANRANALEALIDADGLRDQARAIRAKALARLDELLEKLADQVDARGGQVCWAEDGAAACRYITKLARDRGVKLVIDSDAHYIDALDYPRWGILTARRAWVTKEDVLNTLPVKEFRKRLRRNR